MNLQIKNSVNNDGSALAHGCALLAQRTNQNGPPSPQQAVKHAPGAVTSLRNGTVVRYQATSGAMRCWPLDGSSMGGLGRVSQASSLGLGLIRTAA
jgi:hypothetical protein